MTLLNVLGVLGVLNVLTVLNVIYVLNVLNMPIDASLACWALFFSAYGLTLGFGQLVMTDTIPKASTTP